jgi:uncharacterized YccA/Bax inhibitor family protein
MTVGGTVNKAALLMAMSVASAAITWMQVSSERSWVSQGYSFQNLCYIYMSLLSGILSIPGLSYPTCARHRVSGDRVVCVV